MCGIIGSYSKTKFIELANLNSYRGQLSHSIAIISHGSYISYLEQSTGKMDEGIVKDIPMSRGDYIIGHVQAPTSEAGLHIHPARWNTNLLWHNGIIKSKDLAPGEWDTEYMLRRICNEGFECLSDIDGSFACLLYLYQKGFFIFRNEISPLFIDKYTMDISSTKFFGSQALEPNVVINMKDVSDVYRFKTKNNPYFIPNSPEQT